MRIRPLADPVTVRLDGEAVPAERGEPVVAALVAAGHLTLARSPKFHRPRGPSCLRAGCDGCLARVDGVPNVMTCRVPAAEGMLVETQNVVGSRERDLLRVADWFFPEGLNHHELLAGVPGVSRVMQGLARRIAGLGTLPEPRSPDLPPDVPSPPAIRRTLDALVIGAGPFGMGAAVELASRGRTVEVVDDDLTWGGSLRALPGDALSPWTELAAAFERALDAGVRLRSRTTAAGIYGDDVLLASPEGVDVVTARTLVLAPGAHDGVLAFEGNDLPGVMSARAACRLLSHGVVPGPRIVAVSPAEGARYADAYARARPDTTRVVGLPLAARGTRRVRAIVVATRDGKVELPCDAVLVDAAGAPSYELAAQAGARLRPAPHGFVVEVGAGARISAGGRVLALGEVTGAGLDPGAVRDGARALESDPEP
jgi:sarcosine oxidase subunit alpha